MNDILYNAYKNPNIEKINDAENLAKHKELAKRINNNKYSKTIK